MSKQLNIGPELLLWLSNMINKIVIYMHEIANLQLPITFAVNALETYFFFPVG